MPYYFGIDRDEALRRYVDEWPRIIKGENRYGIVAPVKRDEAEPLTVRELVNLFLTAKREQVDSGERTPGLWAEYHRMAEQVIEAFGRMKFVSDLQPADFGRLRVAAASRLGAVALDKFITMARTMFGFAFSERLIPSPVWYGDRFRKPEQKALRAARNARPKKMLSATDCWKLIDNAGTQIRGMIWLALNCGFGADRLCPPAASGAHSRTRLGRVSATKDRNESTRPALVRNNLRARGSPAHPSRAGQSGR